MLGDRIILTPYHQEIAAQILAVVRQMIDGKPVAVSIAGESGSGKTGAAHCLAGALDREGWRSVILHMDDYFKLPPRTNNRKREADLDWVGPGEVQLDLLDAHVRALKDWPDRPLLKPLVDFEEDCIDSEVLPPEHREVIIVEGTYSTLLREVDLRVLIDRDYRQTRAERRLRGRDPDSEFIETVLSIEHEIISSHRQKADLVIEPCRA